MAEFAKELTSFSTNVVDIVLFENADKTEMKMQWKESCEEGKAQEDELEGIKLRNKVVFVTPAAAVHFFGFVGEAECFSLVIDKVNLHQAYDLDQDLIELVKCKNFPKSRIFKTIFTTNNKSDDMDESAKENYMQIKKSFMGKEKALVV